MILHHYIWGDIDIDIIDEVAPHFLIAKHYGNLALFCRLTKHQNHYFRNSDKRFYTAGFDDEGKSMNPSDEYIPFVPDILYDDDGIGYLCLMQPSWLHTIDDIRHKIDGIIDPDQNNKNSRFVSDIPVAYVVFTQHILWNIFYCSLIYCFY